MPGKENPSFESRLDALRTEAAAAGRVGGAAPKVEGGPIPSAPGYYGRPVLKPPVWTWEVPVYFFVGGLGGMAALVAAASMLGTVPGLTRAALWLAAIGAAVSPILLVLDLGRPRLFLNMLRVFKLRSPMSVGSWVLSTFGFFAVPAALSFELGRAVDPGGLAAEVLGVATVILSIGAAAFGVVLATYTGVLLGATAVPAWNRHRVALPIHFGVAGLGSATAALELLGFRLPALVALGYAAAGVETILWLYQESHRHGAADRALREGAAGWLIRLAALATGPLALGLRATGFVPLAAIAFLGGAFASRFAWIKAGCASANDPEAALLPPPSGRRKTT